MTAQGKLLRLSARADEQVMSDINVTPLVDIMLVLLIVFIITAPVMHQSFKLELPKENAQKHQLQDNDIRIEISGAGAFSLNGTPLDETPLLTELQNIAIRNGTDVRINLHADQVTQYANVARVLALIQQAGLTKVCFVTTPREKEI